MKALKVPYAEKDEAKALGARWNPARKSWYVPDGTDPAPFARWLPNGADAEPSARDSRAAKPVTGTNYIELEHACNPFEECPACRPKLVDSGWLEAHQVVRKLLAGL